MLRSVGWQLFTDVWGQLIDPVFKGQTVQKEFFFDFLDLEDGANTMSRNVCK
jgi:hypothetical protein